MFFLKINTTSKKSIGVPDTHGIPPGFVPAYKLAMISTIMISLESTIRSKWRVASSPLVVAPQGLTLVILAKNLL